MSAAAARTRALRLDGAIVPRLALSPDSEVDLVEVEFPHWNKMKKQVLYQGTASAGPNRNEPDGL